MNSYINAVLSDLHAKYSHEKEYIQSVTEVLGSLDKLIESEPKYKKFKILERIVIPERVIMFKVPWIDDKGEYRIPRTVQQCDRSVQRRIAFPPLGQPRYFEVPRF